MGREVPWNRHRHQHAIGVSIYSLFVGGLVLSLSFSCVLGQDCTWASIKQSIEGAASGSTLLVGCSVIADSTITINVPNLTIQADPTVARPVITCQSSRDADRTAFQIMAAAVGVHIIGLDFRNCANSAIQVPGDCIQPSDALGYCPPLTISSTNFFQSGLNTQSGSFNGKGGAVNVDGVNQAVYIEDSWFDNNFHAVVAARRTLITVMRSNFTNNKFGVEGRGSAITLQNLGTMLLDTCSFLFNSNATGFADRARGGTVRGSTIDRLTMRGCTFRNNTGGSTVSLANAVYGGVDVDSCEFTGNSAYQTGGGVRVQNGTYLNITRSTFRENKAFQQGGAIHSESTPLSLSDSTLSNNFVNATNAQGGAVYASLASRVEITRVKFSGNTFLYTGGGSFTQGSALYVWNVQSVKVSGSDFRNHTWAQEGGAVTLNFVQSVLIDNSTFEDNWSRALGGAVGIKLASPNGNLQVSNSAFRRNMAGWYGVGMSVLGGGTWDQYNSTYGETYALPNIASVSVTNCVFDANALRDPTAAIGSQLQPRLGSGGLDLYGHMSTQITNCTFMRNSGSLGMGGGLGLAGPPGMVNVITGCTFQDNFAAQGAGLYMAEQGYIIPPYIKGSTTFARLRNITFSGNNALYFGGGMYQQSLVSQLDDVHFLGNKAQARPSDTSRVVVSGGGLYATEGNLTINGAVFESNVAGHPNWPAAGGALHALYAATVITGTTFHNNTANIGGAVKLERTGTARVLGCTFHHNAATTSGLTDMCSGHAGDGGALHCDTIADQVVLVQGCTFDSNMADGSGGAYSCVGCDWLQVLDTSFANNSARKSGGALALESNGCPVISNVTFSYNAARGAGAVYMLQAGSKRCTDLNSTSTLSVPTDATAVVTQSNFTGNTAEENGGAISLDSFEGEMVLSDLHLTGNKADWSGGAVWLFVPVIDPVDRTVLFERTTLENNTAGLDGGAVGVSTAVQVTLDMSSTSMAYNVAGRHGGGVFVDGGSVGTDTVLVWAGFASQDQGMRRSLLQSAGDTDMDGCPSGAPDKPPGLLLNSNTAAERGGGLYCRNCAGVSLLSSTLVANVAGVSGGGLVTIQGGRVRLSDCDVAANNVVQGGIGGGAVCDGCEQLRIESSRVRCNSADAGGGVHITGGDLLLIGSNFTYNNAVVSDGGATYFAGRLAAVDQSRFTENSAALRGGAMLLDNEQCLEGQGPEALLLTGNSSVLLSRNASECADNVLLRASLFEQNVAGGAGGAVFAVRRELLVVECTSELNLSGSGGESADVCGSAFANNRVQLVPSSFPSSSSSIPSDIVGLPARLTASFSDGIGNGSMHARDKPLDILVELQDSFGARATGISGWLVQAKTGDPLNLDGTLTATLRQGLATVSLYARSSAGTYSISIQPPAGSQVQDASLQVAIAACPIGTRELPDETHACILCEGPLQYSLSNNRSCSSCPPDGICRGGPVLVPAEGFWHSAYNSPAMHRCPNPEACRYSDRTEHLVQCQSRWYDAEAHGGPTNSSGLPCLLGRVDDLDPHSYMRAQCTPGYIGPACAVCDWNSTVLNGSRYGSTGSFRCGRCASTANIAGTIIGTVVTTSAIIMLSALNYVGPAVEELMGVMRPGDVVQMAVIHSQYLAILTSLMAVREWPSMGLDQLLRAVETVTGLTSTSYACLLPDSTLSDGQKLSGWLLSLAIWQAAVAAILGVLVTILAAWILRGLRKKAAQAREHQTMLKFAESVVAPPPPHPGQVTMQLEGRSYMRNASWAGLVNAAGQLGRPSGDPSEVQLQLLQHTARAEGSGSEASQIGTDVMQSSVTSAGQTYAPPASDAGPQPLAAVPSVLAASPSLTPVVLAPHPQPSPFAQAFYNEQASQGGSAARVPSLPPLQVTPWQGEAQQQQAQAPLLAPLSVPLPNHGSLDSTPRLRSTSSQSATSQLLNAALMSRKPAPPLATTSSAPAHTAPTPFELPKPVDNGVVPDSSLVARLKSMLPRIGSSARASPQTTQNENVVPSGAAERRGSDADADGLTDSISLNWQVDALRMKPAGPVAEGREGPARPPLRSFGSARTSDVVVDVDAMPQRGDGGMPAEELPLGTSHNTAGGPPHRLGQELMQVSVVSLLAAMFVLFPTLLNICFSVFACYKLDDAGDRIDYSQNYRASWEHGYLGLDTRVKCYTGHHRRVKVPAAAAGLAILCVLLPVCLLAILTWWKKRLPEDSQLMRTYGILYRPYRARCYWWGLACLNTLTAALVAFKVLLLSAGLEASDILVVLMAILLFYIALLVSVKPFRRDLQHQIHLHSLFVLVLTAALAIIIVNASDNNYLRRTAHKAKDGAMVAILVVNILLYAFMACCLLRLYWEQNTLGRLVRSVQGTSLVAKGWLRSNKAERDEEAKH